MPASRHPLTAADLYVPESDLASVRYSAAVPREAYKPLARFMPPPDLDPADPQSTIYRAFHHLAQSLADRLPNGQALLTAVGDLHTAMESALVAMRGGDHGNR